MPGGAYDLSVRATDNHGAQTLSPTISILVIEDVATREIGRARSIKVAPNPTGGGFRFLTDEVLAGSVLRVYSADNQLIRTEKLLNNETDLSALPAGPYFLEIETEKHARFRATVVKL